jgi:hypothetical protein
MSRPSSAVRVSELPLALLVALLAPLALLAGACGSSQAAANTKDPIRCERDPACAKERGRYPDCTKQCNDDQECESRCEQVQQGVDSMGHP